jgi:DNA-binding SARP family transcriptional activator/tetratricopeptide (TPR) repeat protein
LTPHQGVTADFGILGSLTATVAGTPVSLPSAKTRIVLVSLLLRPNRVVSVEELVDRLWDEDPPKGARNAAQSYVMRLRNALGEAGALISTHPAGYVIAVSPEMIDLGRFRARVAAADEARTASDTAREARELRAAVAMWRGAPLSDVPSEFLRAHEATRLDEERLQVLERLMDLELALGRHADLIGELYTITADNQLRERFWGQLMLALHRSDRQAEALGVYRKVSQLLRDELGINPGDALREVHQRILASDRPAPAVAPRTDPRKPPFQLPADIPDFVGRDDLLAKIRELTVGPQRNKLAVPLVVLSGPPGAGKTALAVHAAHVLRPEFPDGQLYVNLRGYSTSPPLAATDALARFLRALGVEPERIPHEVDEQSALLRSLLGGRRVLMILDNAASPEHVRPLLPSDGTCAVLVTSRNNLNGLTALNGAKRFPVGVVTAGEAAVMVTNIVGADRVDAEPEAAGSLAALCGYLPLGLRIASTNLAGSESSSIAEYVRMLRSGSRLDAMQIEGDDEAAVRPAFDLSYSTLKPALSRFLRMVGLIPGPDFDRLAAAAVAGPDEAEAQRMLDRLISMNLIGVGATGRTGFHDLIKEFVLERVREQESEDEGRQALAGLFAFYLQWTYSACRMLYADAHLTPPTQQAKLTPAWTDPPDALKWLDVEAENLLAMISTGSAHDLPVWALAEALLPYLQRRRHQSSWKSTFASALTAAERTGDPRPQAVVHAGIARLHFQNTQFAEGRAHMADAARLFHAAGDIIGEARSHSTLGAFARDMDEYDTSIEHLEESLRLFGDGLDPAGRCVTVFNLGMAYIHLGRTDRAWANLALADELAHELDLSLVDARCEGALGFADMWAGRLGSALARFDRALTKFSELKFVPGTIEMVRHAAEVSRLAQRPALAMDLSRLALAKAQEIEADWQMIGCLDVLGKTALDMGDPGTAMRHFDAALIMAGGGVRYWTPTVTLGLAAGHRQEGRLAEAAALASKGTTEQLPRERGRAHTELATVLVAQGDHPSAITHAREAQRIAAAHGYILDHANALSVSAAAHTAMGDTAAAQDDQRHAETLFETGRADIEPALSTLAARIVDQR